MDLDLGLTNLESLAQSLNSAQAFFHFTCPKMPSVKKSVKKIGGLENLVTFLIPSSFFETHSRLTVDLVACLTRYPLAFKSGEKVLYNYFAGQSDEDERFLFISTDQLYAFCKQGGGTFEEGLVYLFVGQLVRYFTDIGYHYETRSCVMDHCETRADQIKGLQDPKFCNSCRSSLLDANLMRALHELISWNY